MARTKKRSYDSITLDGVTMLREQGFTFGKTKLVYKIPTRMNAQDFDRWKVKYSQEIEAYKNGPEAVILTEKNIPRKDKEGRRRIREILKEENDQGVEVPLSLAEYNRLSTDDLVGRLQKRGVFISSSYKPEQVKLMSWVDHVLNLGVMRPKLQGRGAK